MATLQKRVAALLKIDALLPHPNRQPVVLVQAHSGGEGKVGTYADKHAAPRLVVHIEVELIDPALFELQMRAVVLFAPNRHQDAGRFPRFEDHGDSVRCAVVQIGQHEIVAPLILRRIHNRRAPHFSERFFNQF